MIETLKPFEITQIKTTTTYGDIFAQVAIRTPLVICPYGRFQAASGAGFAPSLMEAINAALKQAVSSLYPEVKQSQLITIYTSGEDTERMRSQAVFKSGEEIIVFEATGLHEIETKIDVLENAYQALAVRDSS